jgi:hypothetical protein
MHIHLPKGNLESLRGFLLELFTITCGILIAISLESAVESIHHHHLLREARGNIFSEIRDNHRIIDSTTKEIPGELGMLQNVIAICMQEQAHRGSVDLRKVKSLNLGFTGFALSSDNWSTAQSIGAVSLMDYEEIRKYTSVYKIQSMAASLHQQTLDKWLQLQRIVILLRKKTDLKDFSNDDLAEVVRTASEAYSFTSALQQASQSLTKKYDQILNLSQE